MNNKNWYRIFSGLIFGLLLISESFEAHAQVQDVEIQIANPLKVTLPVAERNFEKIPIKPLEPVYPPLVYGYRPLTFSAPSFRPKIRPLKVREDNLKKSREGYAAIGYGNYGGLLADLYFPVYNDEKSKSSSAVRANHNSFRTGPVGGERSGSGKSSVFMDWRTSSKGLLTEASVGFRNMNANYYGYSETTNLKNDTLGISYYDASVDLKFANDRNANYQYVVSTGFSQLWNNRSANESALKLGGDGRIKAGSKGEIKVQGEYDLFIRQDRAIPSGRRHLAQGETYFRYHGRDLQADVGITGAAENDAAINKFFHFYPLLRLNWRLMPDVMLEGNIGGKMDKVSLHSLTESNIWLDRDVAISHSNERINGSAFFRAGVGKVLSFSAGARYAEISNLFFFVNQASDSSRFGVVYDDARKINPSLSVQFKRGSAAMELKADYYLWEIDQLAAAFHRPEGQVEWNGSFSFSPKFHFRPYALLLWGIKAPVVSEPSSVIELPAVTDIGFRFEFSFSEKGSAQLRVNNLLGTSYSLLQNYPVRGLQGLVGLSWRF